MRETEFAVVGAGLAGLSAARALAAAGRDVLVLEGSDRVGGRTLNGSLGEGGEAVELGGAWAGPTQDALYALAAELGVATFATHTSGDNVLEHRGRLRRYSGTIPKLPPAALVDVELVRRRLGRLVRQIDPRRPWAAPRAREWDGQTFASWLRRSAATPTTRALFRSAGRTLWGAEPEDLSFLFVLFYIASAGSLDLLLDAEGGAQQDRFVGGSQLLSLRMAEALGDRVALSSPVRSVARDGAGVRVRADGEEVRARRAIVAVPPGLWSRIAWDPPLPPAHRELGQRSFSGALAKCFAVFPEPFWREDGLSGEGVADRGPATLTFDVSPPGGSPGVLLGFVGGADARWAAQADPAERREHVLASLARLFGPRAARPEAWLEQDWTGHPWTGGGPTGCLGPGALTAAGAALRAPWGPVLFAGTETSPVWTGYMEGAVRSGQRAAAEALAA